MYEHMSDTPFIFPWLSIPQLLKGIIQQTQEAFKRLIYDPVNTPLLFTLNFFQAPLFIWLWLRDLVKKNWWNSVA